MIIITLWINVNGLSLQRDKTHNAYLATFHNKYIFIHSYTYTSTHSYMYTHT